MRIIQLKATNKAECDWKALFNYGVLFLFNLAFFIRVLGFYYIIFLFPELIALDLPTPPPRENPYEEDPNA